MEDYDLNIENQDHSYWRTITWGIKNIDQNWLEDHEVRESSTHGRQKWTQTLDLHYFWI